MSKIKIIKCQLIGSDGMICGYSKVELTLMDGKLVAADHYNDAIIVERTGVDCSYGKDCLELRIAGCAWTMMVPAEKYNCACKVLGHQGVKL